MSDECEGCHAAEGEELLNGWWLCSSCWSRQEDSQILIVVLACIGCLGKIHGWHRW